MRVAFEHGVNFFDVAESHSGRSNRIKLSPPRMQMKISHVHCIATLSSAQTKFQKLTFILVLLGGQAEIDMGLAIRKHNWKRSDFVISTKIFWGGKGPNDRGLSRKHIIEGLSASLNRLQLDYVDIVYAQRPDPDTPMEETVRAFSWCIDKGMALYWGTSEWPAYLVTEAIAVAKRLGLIEPIVEVSSQPSELGRMDIWEETSTDWPCRFDPTHFLSNLNTTCSTGTEWKRNTYLSMTYINWASQLGRRLLPV